MESEAGWEPLFWIIFERSGNPIMLLDEGRRVVEINQAGVELFGYTRSSLIGRSVTDVIPGDERSTAAADWQRLRQSGEFSGRGHLVRPEGSEVEVDYAARVANVGGRRLAVYVALDADTAQPHQPAGEHTVASLTRREREVITLIALGYDTNGVAAELVVSPETVRSHVRNAMDKLGAHTRAQLVALVLASDAKIELPRLREPD